jgi:ketosteroid isomerase-like protein
MTTSAIPIARRLHEALEAGRYGKALSGLLTDDATMIEHPNLVKPHGARVGLDQMLAASFVGARLLKDQRYEVVDVVDVDGLVVFRLTWSGTVASDVGPFAAGQELTAHVAQFVNVRDGKISSVETYDCYEPF